MSLDTALSLEVVIMVLAILGAVWRLDAKIEGVGQRLDAKIDDTRAELKGDIQRLDAEIDGVRDRVEEGNQRLARLEGRFEGREERLAAAGETDPTT